MFVVKISHHTQTRTSFPWTRPYKRKLLCWAFEELRRVGPRSAAGKVRVASEKGHGSAGRQWLWESHTSVGHRAGQGSTS